MTINERIRFLRKELTLSQKQLAEAMGVTQSGISYIEQAGSTVAESTIKTLIALYGVSEEWLRNGIEPMYKSQPKMCLDEFCKKAGASELELKILKAYFELPQEVRALIINHFKEKLSCESEPLSPKALDIDAEVESYRAELEEQQKKGDGSSASDGSGAKMA